MTEKDWGAVIMFAVVGCWGVLFAVLNRTIGRSFNKFNTGFLISPEKAAGQYRETRSGRYPELIAIGSLMAVGSVVAIVLRVV